MEQLSFDDAETWLPVPEYEGLYDASSQGQIRSRPRATTRGGIMKIIFYDGKYEAVTLTCNGKQRRHSVHSLVAAAFIGPRPEGLVIRHLDGDPQNNWAYNLAYGTQAENMQDMLRHGNCKNANKTHCPYGHEYTPENTFILKSGSRICRTCARAKGRRQSQRRRDAGLVPKWSELPPEKLAAARAYNAKYQRERNARLRQERDLTRACLRCGTVFTPKRSDVHYCSRQCRRKGPLGDTNLW